MNHGKWFNENDNFNELNYFDKITLKEFSFNVLEQYNDNEIIKYINKNMFNDLINESKILYSSLNNNNYIFELLEIVSLKLYADYSNLCNLFEKCFYNNIKQRKSFFLWSRILNETINYHSIIIYDNIYYGLNKMISMNNLIISFNGPISTLNDVNDAKNMCNSGLFWNIKSNNQYYTMPLSNLYGINISWLAQYPNNCEILLFDSYLPIIKTNIFLKY